MEGTEYRRSSLRNGTRRRGSYSKMGEADNSGMLETILTQCIISGVVLLVILLMCLVKTDFTHNIRIGLKNTIAGEMKLEDIRTIFNIPSGFSPDESVSSAVDTAQMEYIDETEKTVGDVVSDTTEPVAIDESGDFRIDEDILAEIISKTDPYGENLKK